MKQLWCVWVGEQGQVPRDSNVISLVSVAMVTKTGESTEGIAITKRGCVHIALHWMPSQPLMDSTHKHTHTHTQTRTHSWLTVIYHPVCKCCGLWENHCSLLVILIVATSIQIDLTFWTVQFSMHYTSHLCNINLKIWWYARALTHCAFYPRFCFMHGNTLVLVCCNCHL